MCNFRVLILALVHNRLLYKMNYKKLWQVNIVKVQIAHSIDLMVSKLSMEASLILNFKLRILQCRPEFNKLWIIIMKGLHNLDWILCKKNNLIMILNLNCNLCKNKVKRQSIQHNIKVEMDKSFILGEKVLMVLRMTYQE